MVSCKESIMLLIAFWSIRCPGLSFVKLLHDLGALAGGLVASLFSGQWNWVSVIYYRNVAQMVREMYTLQDAGVYQNSTGNLSPTG